MQPLTGQHRGHAGQTGAAPARRDPAPSRIAYRLHRLWLTPLFRALLRVGLPAFALVFALGAVFSDAERRAQVVGVWQDLRDAVEARPEFQVTRMEVRGASPTVEAAMHALGPQAFPVSSFHLDLAGLRAEFEALDAVARADLQLRAGGLLDVRIAEREPAIVWRSREGLELLDAEGFRIARLRSRAARADLPLIGGDGADAAVPEALALIAAAAPLGARVIGLTRMGERRWDLVLDRDQRVMLPEREPIAALERVIVQTQTQELLERDVEAVDMRNPARPTVRLSQQALSELRRIRALEQGARNR
ncbi:cell division protein FtsQ/DivIB [Alkalilacustris brevis]|uniref:cell division protein FtsQ/DivIB n=1 Tax=Alkalilacustris brevis TaxID=2026338 RepID=UPI000E0DA1C3|nr:cell division protein FtsQ/DivIB [Alkalilacustris brevis]